VAFANDWERAFRSKKWNIRTAEPEGKEAMAMDCGTHQKKTEEHPCYTCGGAKNARLHLPVAPKCNIQCNYCVRKFDCPNESRPGVTTEVLSPAEALLRYRNVYGRLDNLKVVGIAGPGDALANPEETFETLRLIRAENPDITFCVSTNGLMLPRYAQELIDLDVSHVTVTLNAVDPAIGAHIYQFVNYDGIRYTGEEAASLLLENQLEGLKRLTERGVVCKVNIVALKGINDDHVEEVVKTVRALGVYITNIMRLIPVGGSAFAQMEPLAEQDIIHLRSRCEQHLRQMYHCKHCRADAAGALGSDIPLEGKKMCCSG